MFTNVFVSAIISVDNANFEKPNFCIFSYSKFCKNACNLNKYAFFHKALEERGQVADDPLLFSIRLATKNKTQTGRFIEKLLAVPPENDMLQELKAQIESSDRTKFKTHKIMNPSLTVHKIYEMQANYVEEQVRLSFSRFRLGSHYLRIETGRWSRTRRDERFCDCGNNQVQDEQHVLSDCAKSLFVRNNYPNLNKDIPMIFENNPHQMCTFTDKILELYRT